MTRKPRVLRLAPGLPNHLLIRGNNRRRLFSYPHERLTYIRLLERALVRHQCALHAICLMDNHVHLLATPPTIEAASRCMQQVNQRYAQKRNTRRGGSGKLFEQSFESKPVYTAQQLAHTVMYIDANPFRAGIANAESYAWSSLGYHLGDCRAAKVKGDLIEPDAWYLSLGASATARAQQYRQLFGRYLEADSSGARRPEREPNAPYVRRLLRPDGSSAAEPNSKRAYGLAMSDD